MKIGEILNGERGGLFLTVLNPPRFVRDFEFFSGLG